MRNAMLILVALITDGTQAFLTAGFLGMGGAVSGSTLGIAGPIAMPAAVAIGFTTDVVTSFTFGSGLLLVLSYYGMFYAPYTLGGSIVEIIPGLDVVPGWTIMTILCIVKKSREEGGTLGNVAGTLLTVVAPEARVATGATQAATTVTAPAQQTAQTPQAYEQESREASRAQNRVVSDLKNIDEIKPNRAYAA